MSATRGLFAAAVALQLAFLFGCGKSETQAPPVSGEAGLKELVRMYEFLAYEKRPMPRKVDDLTEFFDTIPNALPRIQSGEYVLIWGVGLSKSSNAVLAYEKKAPTEGGAVLLRNGVVKQMSADEFSKAPKAR